MTLLNVVLTVPTVTGELAPATGVVRFTPTRRRVVDGVTVLPIPCQAPLVAGAVTVDLAPNDLLWVWRIDEHVHSAPGRTIFVNVPDVEAVNYTDLIPLDPETLSPAPPSAPAWLDPLNTVAAGAVTPDPDHPGFYLIGVTP